MEADWAHTLLDGFLGGVMGAMGAFVAAWFLVRREAKSARLTRQADLRQQALALFPQMRTELITASASNDPDVILAAWKEARCRWEPLFLPAATVSSAAVSSLGDLSELINRGYEDSRIARSEPLPDLAAVHEIAEAALLRLQETQRVLAMGFKGEVIA